MVWKVKRCTKEDKVRCLVQEHLLRDHLIGLLPDGMLALIDVGYLSDDPKDFPLYEGMPRTSQYEADLRNNFTEENFTHFFGKKPRTRTRSPNPRAKSLLLA